LRIFQDWILSSSEESPPSNSNLRGRVQHLNIFCVGGISQDVVEAHVLRDEPLIKALKEFILKILNIPVNGRF
jgi:hypothetical protein